MTENFLQKLEEKIISLLSELEILRKEYGSLKQECLILQIEKENTMKKLHGLVSLMDKDETKAHSSDHFQESCEQNEHVNV